MLYPAELRAQRERSNSTLVLLSNGHSSPTRPRRRARWLCGAMRRLLCLPWAAIRLGLDQLPTAPRCSPAASAHPAPSPAAAAQHPQMLLGFPCSMTRTSDLPPAHCETSACAARDGPDFTHVLSYCPCWHRVCTIGSDFTCHLAAAGSARFRRSGFRHEHRLYALGRGTWWGLA
jgi:hypothetical protein